MKNKYFLKNKRIYLALPSLIDLDQSPWLESINDYEFTKNFSNLGHLPISYDDEVKFMSELDGKRDLVLGIYIFGEESMIGTVSVKNIDWVHRSCSHSQMIFPQYRSFQNFYDSNKLLIDHVFNRLNLNRISGGSIEKIQADMMIKFFGFEQEGIAREVNFKDGKYHDAYLIGLTKSRWIEFNRENEI